MRFLLSSKEPITHMWQEILAQLEKTQGQEFTRVDAESGTGDQRLIELWDAPPLPPTPAWSGQRTAAHDGTEATGQPA
eukprot:2964224-Rhodomonas_salina.1